MGYLRSVGFLSSVLFVGVLGGLLAPLAAEAVPTLTVQFDGVTVSPSILITTPATCTTAETNLGFTACYGIRTGTTQYSGVPSDRKFMIQTAPGTVAARLRVADKVGQDKFSLIGVQFVPVAWTSPTAAQNINEQHVITITMTNTFDSAVNVTNNGNYVWALRTGGEFRAGPTTANACAGTSDGLCDAVGDTVVFTGKGTFSPTLQNVDILSKSPSTTNLKPLSFTVAGPHEDPILSYDGLTNATMGQVNPTYPTFLCDLDGTLSGRVCKPTITQTMTVTLKGQDTFVLVNGDDLFAANCSAGLSKEQDKQLDGLAGVVRVLKIIYTHHPTPLLLGFINQTEGFLATVHNNPDPNCPGATLVNLDIATASSNDQVAFATDNAVPGVPAAQTGGTLVINKTMSTVPGVNARFRFVVTGGTFGTENEVGYTDGCCFHIDTDGGTGGVGPIGTGSVSFFNLPTGGVPGIDSAFAITEFDFPALPNPGDAWYTRDIACQSQVNQDTGQYLTQWEINNSMLGPVLHVIILVDNDTLTCTFDNAISSVP